MKPQRFTAKLREGAFEVPFDVKAVYGTARAAVKMTVLGETHRTRVMVYGGKYTLGLWKRVLDAHELADGARVDVVVEADVEPRVVVPPSELAKALAKDARAKAGWAAMSFTHQREWAEAVADAKQAATRARRVAKAIDAMHAKAATKKPPRNKRGAK